MHKLNTQMFLVYFAICRTSLCIDLHEMTIDKPGCSVVRDAGAPSRPGDKARDHVSVRERADTKHHTVSA